MAFLLNSQSPLLINSIGLVSLFPISLGFAALAKPRQGLPIFGIQEPKTNEAKILADSLMQLAGIRDISLGLALLAAYKFGDSRTLGWTVLAGTFTAAGDGWVSSKQVMRTQWLHWAFVPCGLVSAVALLGYFD